MEGFKSLPKMQHFKEGGAVKSKYAAGGMAYKKGGHAESEEMKKDVAQDKAIVKKAFKMHDTQSHEGEKTDLSKLKKGGRMKKEGGCVGRYKSGGSIKMPKTGGSDVSKDGGKKTGGADIKTGMKTGSSDVKKEGSKTGSSDANKDGGITKGLNNVFKKGGAAKKYADGGMAGQGAVSDYERSLVAPKGQGAISDTEKLRLANRAKNRAMLSPSQQRELDAQEAAAAAAAMRGQGTVSDAERGTLGRIMGRKKGGTIKKYAEGGSLKPVDKEENPGLAKLPTNVRNKMGYAKKGGKVC